MSIEIVFEKRINNANVCRDVDVTQRRQYFLLTFLSAMFVLGLLLYGWQQYRWVSLGYEIGRAEETKKELLENQRQLVLQRNNLARPERIEHEAKDTLGMVAAAEGQIVRLTPGDLGAPEAATPLTASTGAR